jgi:hypothetical protein
MNLCKNWVYAVPAPITVSTVLLIIKSKVRSHEKGKKDQ